MTVRLLEEVVEEKAALFWEAYSDYWINPGDWHTIGEDERAAVRAGVRAILLSQGITGIAGDGTEQ